MERYTRHIKLNCQKKSTVNDCRVINLKQINDERGNLSFIESNRDVPFTINRIYYLFDVPGGAVRGSHAHKNLQQLIIAIGGSFTIRLNDGQEEKIFNLNRAYEGLYIPSNIWRTLDNFSSGSCCLVLASEHFDEGDYIRDWEEYLKYKLSNTSNVKK